MPLGPPVMTGPIFQTIGAAAVQALRDSDAAFGDVALRIAPLTAGDLDSSFTTDVAPALAALAAIDPTADDGVIVKIFATLDAIRDSTDAQLVDLPGPETGDPDIGPIEPPVDPGAGHDITAGDPPPPPAPDLVGPDELHTIAVSWFAVTFGVAPTDAELVALAAGFGYVQGTSVERAAVWAYLNSPAARAAVGR